MGDTSSTDWISDLPQSIIENILVRLPIRDAIRTSILSSKWRYKWSTITHLVFDYNCVTPANDDRGPLEGILGNFVTRTLFLHQGPIHKFQVSSSFSECHEDIDQWLLFLSRNGIKELVLELEGGEFFRVPSCLFNFQNLTRLELSNCELHPPPSFKGFACLKNLSLDHVLVAPEVIETLISGCPLLESLSLSYFDSLLLNISAPNLKCLYLDGEFKDILLENAPKLMNISVSLYISDDSIEHWERSSSCNFAKFLGGITHLERIVGYVYFTKFLSIGIDSMRPCTTYEHLKIIELYQVSFEDVSEVLVVLHLITHSPNLQELKVSGSPNQPPRPEDIDMYIWEKEKGCPLDYKLHKLKSVTMTEMYGIQNELEFIKYLLANSPALETMTLIPYLSDHLARVDILIELLKFRRASSQAEILYFQDQT